MNEQSQETVGFPLTGAQLAALIVYTIFAMALGAWIYLGATQPPETQQVVVPVLAPKVMEQDRGHCAIWDAQEDTLECYLPYPNGVGHYDVLAQLSDPEGAIYLYVDGLPDWVNGCNIFVSLDRQLLEASGLFDCYSEDDDLAAVFEMWLGPYEPSVAAS